MLDIKVCIKLPSIIMRAVYSRSWLRLMANAFGPSVQKRCQVMTAPKLTTAIEEVIELSRICPVITSVECCGTCDPRTCQEDPATCPNKCYGCPHASHMSMMHKRPDNSAYVTRDRLICPRDGIDQRLNSRRRSQIHLINRTFIQTF